MDKKIPKYLFISRKKLFFKTTYSFYNSDINCINFKKDYSNEEPYISITIPKFKKISPLDIVTKNNILIGKLVYFKGIKEWHFIHRGKKMIIKFADIDDSARLYFRSLFVILTKNMVNETFLRSYYHNVIKIVRQRKLNDMKHILETLDNFKDSLSIKTYENYDPEKEDICTICFMKNDKSKKIKLQCGHSFHLECFNIWYKQKRICPLCKYKIKIDSFLAEKDCSLHTSKPTIYNNKLSQIFSPLKNGKASIKNIKLKSNSGNKYKFLKIGKNDFAVEYKEPLKNINAIVITLINLIS